MFKQFPSPRRIVLAAAVAAAALAIPAVAAFPQAEASARTSVSEKATLTADRTTVHLGDVVTFRYSTPKKTFSEKNWFAVLPANVAPGDENDRLWGYLRKTSGTFTVDTHSLTQGAWKVYYFNDDGYDSLAGPLTLTVKAPVKAPPVLHPVAPSTGVGPGHPNLIVNGGAELGEGSEDGTDTNTVPGWTMTGLLNSTRYGAQGSDGVMDYPTLSATGPVNRGQNLFSGGGGGVSTGTQTADVSAAASHIDRGGVTYDLTGWLGGTDALTDHATVTSVFLDRRGRALGTATLGTVTHGMRYDETALLPRQAKGTVPRGTRAIRTVLTITGPKSTDGPGHGQAYADNLTLTLSAPVPAPAIPAVPTAHVPGYDHVFVVMMENQNYGDIIGNTKEAPYINSLAPKGANLTNAIAEVHPSSPNYVALSAGSLHNVQGNSVDTTTVHAPHIGDLVEGNGGTWRAYLQGANKACDTGEHGEYSIDEVPFYFYDDVRNNPESCTTHMLPLSSMGKDLKKASTTPTFSWFAADDCYDMEGCGIKAGDTWLSKTLPTILDSPAWKNERSLLLLTFDEDAANGQTPEERVPTIILGSQGVRAGSSSPARYTHYSMLRTIEAALGLPNLTKNDLYAQPINDIWTTPGRRRTG